MSAFRRRLRQTMTIARRDFIATVFTPIFLLFLLAPAMMASFGAIGGLGAASVSARRTADQRLVVALPREQAAAVRDADATLRRLFPHDERPPRLDVRVTDGAGGVDLAAALRTPGADVRAAMAGDIGRPRILHRRGERDDARYLAALADRAVLASIVPGVRAEPVIEEAGAGAIASSDRNASAFAAVFGVFFLTLFLSGQVIGTMAEERNNKVIEVLAAAVPLESVFLGKLVGMFGVAVLFVGFWAAILGPASALVPDVAFHPAVGMGWFAALFAIYFALAYLLLGSVFLGIGAQASTMREIQLLSLPVTIVQVAMFAFASAATSRPGSALALAAEVFPLSSPFAMAGRAASSAQLWPHLLAIVWQAMWVALFVSLGARLFRRGVLQSGSPTGVWRRLLRRPAAVDTPAAPVSS